MRTVLFDPDVIPIAIIDVPAEILAKLDGLGRRGVEQALLEDLPRSPHEWLQPDGTLVASAKIRLWCETFRRNGIDHVFLFAEPGELVRHALADRKPGTEPPELREKVRQQFVATLGHAVEKEFYDRKQRSRYGEP